jgi:hypothetical protein
VVGQRRGTLRSLGVTHHLGRPYSAVRVGRLRRSASAVHGTFDFSQERNWAISPDGSFIMIRADPTLGRELRVVFNWFGELARTSKAK